MTWRPVRLTERVKGGGRHVAHAVFGLLSMCFTVNQVLSPMRAWTCPPEFSFCWGSRKYTTPCWEGLLEAVSSGEDRGHSFPVWNSPSDLVLKLRACCRQKELSVQRQGISRGRTCHPQEL